MVDIVILGKGCQRCDTLEDRVRNVVREKNINATVRHIRDLNEIASYGFVITPALLVDGKLKAAGKDLTEAELDRILLE
jgi:small redox-active disulfide protein 2